MVDKKPRTNMEVVWLYFGAACFKLETAGAVCSGRLVLVEVLVDRCRSLIESNRIKAVQQNIPFRVP